MQKNSTAKLVASIVGAAIFALLGLKSFVNLFQDFAYLVQGYGGFAFLFMDVIYMIGYFVLTAGILILGIEKADQKLGILSFAGACAVALAELIYFISGFSYGRYAIWDYFRGDTFNFLCMLPSFFVFLAWALFAMVAAIGTLRVFAENKAKFKTLWFIPPAVLLFSKIVKAICMVVYSDVWYGGGSNGFFASFASPALLSFTGFVGTVFVMAAMCAAGILLLNPDMLVRASRPAYQTAGAQTQYQDGTQQTAGYQTQGAAQQPGGPQAQYYDRPQMPEGYCDMVKHVLLLIFTFGIWQMIWIYKTTEFLNRTPQEQQRSGVCQLLLCVFVPFYIIYWVYASCKRIDKLAYYNGVYGEITVMCVLFEIFIAILAPIFMQEKINNIVIFRRQSQGGPAPGYPGYQPNGYQQPDAQQPNAQPANDGYQQTQPDYRQAPQPEPSCQPTPDKPEPQAQTNDQPVQPDTSCQPQPEPEQPAPQPEQPEPSCQPQPEPEQPAPQAEQPAEPVTEQPAEPVTEQPEENK